MKLLLCCLGLVLVFPAMAGNVGSDWLVGPEAGISVEFPAADATWSETTPGVDSVADAALREVFDALTSHTGRGVGDDDGMVWEPVIYGPGMSREVMASTVWDDGTGPALYAGGQLLTAGRHQALGIARWDGNEWTPLGLGLNGTVRAMLVYQGDLVVAGGFTHAANSPTDVIQVNNIARWDGQSWSPVGSGFKGPTSAAAVVMSLAEYEGDLIAGGTWLPDADQPTSWIARWDGSQWAEMGGGFNQTVWSLAVMNGELYAGGTFTRAGGQNAQRVARWDGTQWVEVGGGMNNGVIRLAVFNGELYAGGPFTNAGGNFAGRIARWDGNTWSAVGTGLIGTNLPMVRSLFVSSGGELVVAGTFTHAGGQPANHIARWNGSAWAPLAGPSGSGVSGMVGQLNGELGAVSTVSEFQGKIIGGGMFYRAGGIRANYIAQWADGEGWSPLPEAVGTGMVNYSDINNAPARAVAQLGDDLIVGGGFDDIGGISHTGRIARWDGQQWHAMGNGVDVINPAYGQNVTSMTAAGGDVYIGGDFASVSGVSGTSAIARWDGSQWHAVSQGMTGAPPGLGVSVETMIEFEGDIIAGGTFLQASGVAASGVARWDGNTWSGMSGGTNGTVSATAVYQGELIIGGSFTQAGGANVNYVARWDGSQWVSLGSGMNSGVLALTVHNGELIAAGWFTQAGGVTASHVARWDGSQWQALAGGIFGGSPRVSELLSFNGSLFATGMFNNADGGGQTITVNNIARWDGSRWWPLAGPMGNGLTGQPNNPWAFSLGVYDPPGPAPARLVAGGFHLLTGGVPSWGLGFYGPATLEVGPQTLDFGAVQVGQTAGPLTLTLASNAGANLTISQIESSDGVFEVGPGDCGPLPVVLGSGDSCDLEISFQPAANGQYAETITLFSNAPVDRDTVSAHGVGSAGALALLPGTVDFGDIVVGSPAGARSVTLINADSGVVNVASVNVPVGPFTAAGGSCGPAPFTLSAQAECTLLFDYAPTGPGIDSADVVVTHNGAGGSQLIALTGAAHAHQLDVAPTSLDFGTVGLGQSAPTQVLTLNNPASVVTTVSTLDLPAAPFVIVASSCGTAPFQLAPGSACALEVGFNPTAVGAVSDIIGVDGDGVAAPLNVALQGTGTGARLAASPSTVAMTLQPGSAGSAQSSLSNVGDATLEWQVIQTTQTSGLVLRPRGLASPPTTVGVQSGGDGEMRPGPAGVVTTATGQQWMGSDSGNTITHSSSMEVVPESGIACGGLGFTGSNSYLRTFDLDDFGLTEGLTVSEITFGVEIVNALVPVSVNLYTLDGAFVYSNMTLIASAEVLVPAQQLGLVTVPIEAVVPARSVLVVEIEVPNLLGLAAYFPGANNLGESAPSYWASATCDILNPVTYESAGFPGVHLVMAVSGHAPANCVLPPWADAGTGQGTIPPSDTQSLSMDFDASGLSLGTYHANLCLESNDGVTPITVLPLILNVADDLLFRDRFE